MNVKLKTESAARQLLRLPDDVDLFILIREDLKAHKLSAFFQEMGCTDNRYLPDLSDLVLEKAGFTERPTELYDFYFDLLAQRCGQLNGSNETLMEMVMEVYAALVDKRKT